MGLTFSAPKLVKNQTLILIISKFPENKNLCDKIWDMWKTKKDEIKLDGFSINKDIDTNDWKIMYHVTNNGKKINPDFIWKPDFEEKYDKWSKQIMSEF